MPPAPQVGIAGEARAGAEVAASALEAGRAWRFCGVWALAVAALVLAIGLFDALIDPYLVIGAPRLAGLNAAKPETETHAQVAKDSLLARLHPVTVMIGSSKVEIGLDPESPAWPRAYRPVFNYGVPGIGMVSNLDDLRRALGLGTVRHALVAVDVVELMAPPPDRASGGAHPAAAASGSEKPWQTWSQRLKDVLLATLSVDALRASLVTIAAQQPDSIDMTDAGSANEAGFRHDVMQDGSIGLFMQKDTDNLRALDRLAHRVAVDPEMDPERWAAVSSIMALCRDRGVDLVVVILPSHADYYEAIARAGLWGRYQAVTERLTRLVAQEGGGRVPLWDFAGYDQYSTEQVPGPRGDPAADGAPGAAMRWYWEPSHFKRIVGEKVLEAIYRGTPGYGVLLTPGTIGTHLAVQNAARARYRLHDAGTRARLSRAASIVARETK